jgi:hypothetical protein
MKHLIFTKSSTVPDQLNDNQLPMLALVTGVNEFQDEVHFHK